jgi:FixJ family two-component response regulator
VRQSSLIAIIDDDEGMRVSLDQLLRSLGHRTVLFASAEAFLESQSAPVTHCVISDIHMPGGMSGLDLAHRLAEDHPPTPIILMSAYSNRDQEEQAKDLRVYCLLPKPFDDDTVIACLERALVA